MTSIKTITLLAVTLMSILGIGAAVQCYECNVWKAGYGNKCDQPRIRDDCTVCMKVETVVKIGYYKNTPRVSKDIARICAKSNTIHFSNECMRYDTSDGTSTRCYCDADLCNSAPSMTFLPAVVLFAVLCLLRPILL